MSRVCAFKANKSAQHITDRWSKEIYRLKVPTVSSDGMGQHRAVNDKTHRVDRDPTMTGERVLRVLRVPRPAEAVILNSHQCLRGLPH